MSLPESSVKLTLIMGAAIVIIIGLALYINSNPELKEELKQKPDYTLTPEKLFWGVVGLALRLTLGLILSSDEVRIASERAMYSN